MHAAATPVEFLWLIPVLPALGVLFNLFIGPRAGRAAVNFVSPAVVGVAFVVACYTFSRVLGLPHGGAVEQDLYPWITAGMLQVQVAFRIDALSGVMILIVTGVGFLIHVYSTGYMHDDEGYAR